MTAPEASLVASDDARVCGWCRSVMTTTAVASRGRRRFCGRKCRQSAFRLRRRHTTSWATASPGAFRYADPPYPGTSSKYYRDEPSFAGEVDFAALIASLRSSRDSGECLGWALSTSARSLRELLPLCPPEARVCAWVKPIGVSPRTYGLHNAWEPVIVVVGRHRRPGKPDWLRAMPARGEGTLPGRKPIAFCAWLFELLGMLPGDRLIDMFPGTGIVSRAWEELSSGYRATSFGSAATLPESATVVPSRNDGRRRRSSTNDRRVAHAGVDDVVSGPERRVAHSRRRRRSCRNDGMGRQRTHRLPRCRTRWSAVSRLHFTPRAPNPLSS